MILASRKSRIPTGIVNSVSADQIAAEQVGQDTQFSSMQFLNQRGTSDGGCMKALSWNKAGIPLAAENDPYVIFRRVLAVETARERLEIRNRNLSPGHAAQPFVFSVATT